jgi:integrase
MSVLRQALDDYFTLRRALGYHLIRSEKLLNQFLDYLEHEGAATITVAQALSWARLPSDATVNWWAQRLSVVRGFATYLYALDPRTEIPPPGLLPSRPSRANPYLYSEGDIAALLATTTCLRTARRQATYRTLIGLLAVTGMRIGEAIRVDLDDIDFSAGLLLVRRSKFGKSRELILHPTTLRALAHYIRVDRRRRHPAGTSPALFISSNGNRLTHSSVHLAFHRLLRKAGITARSTSCRPRIHDLRHSFAVRSLLDAYAAGENGQTTLTLLSTYLGHVNPAGTYWYLSASPELMAVVGQRLERYLGGRR